MMLDCHLDCPILRYKDHTTIHETLGYRDSDPARSSCYVGVCSHTDHTRLVSEVLSSWVDTLTCFAHWYIVYILCQDDLYVLDVQDN